MRRLFISGLSGLLGVNAAFLARDRYRVSGCYLTHPVVVPGVEGVRLDLTDGDEVRRFFLSERPQVVLHTAGLTNVDGCELNPELAQRLNVDATEHVAQACRQIDARLIHMSTDHLFDGRTVFAAETAEPSPLNVYARTKLAAEQVIRDICPRAFIVRTNFFGWGTPVRRSFTDWILDGLSAGRSMYMFSDVFITPILVNSLVETLLELEAAGVGGVLNVAGRERISKYAFGLRVASTFGYPADLITAGSIAQVSLRAPRPRDMSLSTEEASRLVGREMPAVDEGLAALRALKAAGWPARLESALTAAAEPRSRIPGVR